VIENISKDEIKAELIANTSEAVEKGAFGIPTFFCGDEMFYGKDTLRELKEMSSKKDNC
jgi:2-hydroxychromene-2-carboxylate isomerase